MLGDGATASFSTLHRSRCPARRHVGGRRVVVDPAHREVGLGRRLTKELLDIVAELGLDPAVFELVAEREMPAIRVAVLQEWINDYWGDDQDLKVLEMPLRERHFWWF